MAKKKPTEYGITMDESSVLAILAGEMTGDRRVLGGAPFHHVKAGGRLWVRETWMAWDRTSYKYDDWEPWTRERRGRLSYCAYREERGEPDAIEYRATSDSIGPWAPATHMPRWASRITLEVTAVREERLQDITGNGVEAAGVVFPSATGITPAELRARWEPYRREWDRNHRKYPEFQWAANPMVRVFTFHRVEADHG